MGWGAGGGLAGLWFIGDDRDLDIALSVGESVDALIALTAGGFFPHVEIAVVQVEATLIRHYFAGDALDGSQRQAGVCGGTSRGGLPLGQVVPVGGESFVAGVSLVGVDAPYDRDREVAGIRDLIALYGDAILSVADEVGAAGVDGLLAQAEYDDDQRGGNGCKHCKYSGHIFPRVLQMAKCCFFFSVGSFQPERVVTDLFAGFELIVDQVRASSDRLAGAAKVHYAALALRAEDG